MKAAERLRIAYKLAGELGMDSDKLQSEYAKMVEMIESAGDFANAPPQALPQTPPMGQPVQPLQPQPTAPMPVQPTGSNMI